MPSERNTSSKVAVNLVLAIPDQELDWSCTLAELMGQIPGLLHDPGAGRIRRYPSHEDSPGI